MPKDDFTDLFPPSALDGVLDLGDESHDTACNRQDESVPLLSDRHVYSVSELIDEIRVAIDTRFGPIWLRGEISNFSRAASNHCYFTLREGTSCLRCVMFRSAASTVDFSLKDGLDVNCHGFLNIYAARGDLQLVVDCMEQAGRGLLFEQLEKLKKRLEKEGLFATGRKKPVPAFARRIFLVTSPSGAAVRDFIRTARNRWRGVEIILVPTLVQGDDARFEIVRAIARADAAARHGDVIVVTRGGGSLEDLWAFNEEEVVRAVASCRTPVISAIGHETDFALTDYAADLRAATPTAAAAAVTPDAAQLGHAVNVLLRRTVQAMNMKIAARRHHAEVLRHRLKNPVTMLVEQRQRLDEAVQRMRHAVDTSLVRKRERISAWAVRLKLCSPDRWIEGRKARVLALGERLVTAMNSVLSGRRAGLEQTTARLDSVSPLSVLARGYSLVMRQEGRTLIRDSDEVIRGDRLVIKPCRGEILCEVLESHDRRPPQDDIGQE